MFNNKKFNQYKSINLASSFYYITLVHNITTQASFTVIINKYVYCKVGKKFSTQFWYCHSYYYYNIIVFAKSSLSTGLLLNVLNVHLLLHPAAPIILCKGTPNLLALLVLADLTLCGLKIFTSIPASAITVYVHLAIVSLDTGFNGLL